MHNSNPRLDLPDTQKVLWRMGQPGHLWPVPTLGHRVDDRLV